MEINEIEVKSLISGKPGLVDYSTQSKEELRADEILGGRYFLGALIPAFFDRSSPDAKDSYIVVNSLIADDKRAYNKLLKKLKKVSRKTKTPVLITERRSMLTWLKEPKKSEVNEALLRKAGFYRSKVPVFAPEPKAVVSSEFDPERNLEDVDTKTVWEYTPK